MSRSRAKRVASCGRLSYEESKRLVTDGDIEVRTGLAARNDLRP